MELNFSEFKAPGRIKEPDKIKDLNYSGKKMSEVGAKIFLSRLKKDYPDYTWESEAYSGEEPTFPYAEKIYYRVLGFLKARG